MNCQPIAQRLAELRTQQRGIQALLANLQGAGLQVATENLANITADIAEQERSLADCQAVAAMGGTPRAFTARVKNIRCGAASREVGKEEPYVLIASIDRLATLDALPLNKPAVHCVKVGPWSGIKDGSVSAPPSNLNPAFWDLDARARTLAESDDVVFLIGMVENDGSSPDAIRGAVQSALGVGIWNNLNRDYATFASTLASTMQGAIESSAMLGLDPLHLNADDLIGSVAQLPLSADDICTINALGTLEKALTFSRKNGSGKITEQYTVTFLFDGV